MLRRLPGVLPSDPAFLSKHGVDQMVGDVNIFLSKVYDSDSDSDADPDAPPTTPPRTRCEVELMIAVPSTRRRGFGRAALEVFLPYAAAALDLPASAFFCRIGLANEPSLNLFEKVGFRRVKVVEAFGEVEMGFEGDKWTWEPAFEVLEVEPEAR